MIKKRILIDARMYGLEHSGIGRYLIKLIDELVKLNTQEQFTIILKKKYFNALKLPESWNKISTDTEHYSLSEQIILPKIIAGQKPDLVHFPHFNIPIFWKGKYIVTIHDMTMHKKKLLATNLPLIKYITKRISYNYIFKKAVKDSVKIITPSKAVKKEISRYYNVDEEKIVSIYESYDNSYSKELKSRSVLKRMEIENEYFIYTGNLYPHKNINRTVEAISYVNKRKKVKVMLILAGSNDKFKEKIEKSIRENKASEVVRFLGYVSDKDLLFLYKNAIGFIYPSLSEGFGLQGLEAMASGTLLLASDIPVFKEVYGDNPLYFNPYDFSSITEAMKKALETKEKDREERIVKAKRFIQRYSWTKMAKTTMEVYRNALQV